MVDRLRYMTWFGWKRIVSRPLLSILCLLAFIYFCAVFTVMAHENVDFATATEIILPAFFGNTGSMESPSLLVEIMIVVGLIASIAFLAIITAKITSSFMEFTRLGGVMTKRVDSSGHIVICGWNFQGERIVKELLSPDLKRRLQIVVVANVEMCPVKDLRAEFIRGDPTQNADLARAGVMRANSVIVLTDLHKGPNEADAEALMIVLAVKSLSHDVHTCVQLLNCANRVHLERARADEIICLDQLGGNLAVASALNHGLSHVLSDLLTFEVGSEFYRYDGHLSDGVVGKEFYEAAQLLAQRRMILLAVETSDSEELRRELGADGLHRLPSAERVLVINPQAEYKVRQGDALFVVSDSEPTEI